MQTIWTTNGKRFLMTTTDTTGDARAYTAGQLCGSFTMGSGTSYVVTSRVTGISKLRQFLAEVCRAAETAKELEALMNGGLDPEKAKLYETIETLEKLTRKLAPKARKARIKKAKKA